MELRIKMDQYWRSILLSIRFHLLHWITTISLNDTSKEHSLQPNKQNLHAHFQKETNLWNKPRRSLSQ